MPSQVPNAGVWSFAKEHYSDEHSVGKGKVGVYKRTPEMVYRYFNAFHFSLSSEVVLNIAEKG